MSPDQTSKKCKNKSVRFPADGNVTSAHYNYERDDSGNSDGEEVDYFSLPGRSGSHTSHGVDDGNPFTSPNRCTASSTSELNTDSRQSSISPCVDSGPSSSTNSVERWPQSDSSDDERSEDEHEALSESGTTVKATTRANTLYNTRRQRAIPESTRIPMEDTCLPDIAATSIHSKTQLGMDNYLAVGNQPVCMVPGEGGSGDDDPVDREYRERIKNVLDTLGDAKAAAPTHRRANSMPISPISHFTSGHSSADSGTESITLRDLPPINRGLSGEPLERSLHTRESSLTDTYKGDDSLERVDLKQQDVDPGNEKRNSSESSKSAEYDPRQEAEDLAQHLVAAHLSKAGPTEGSDRLPIGYIATDQYLYAAGAVDDINGEGEAGAEGNGGLTQQESIDNLEVGQVDIAPPERVREGVLGSLLRLYGSNGLNKSHISVGSSTGEDLSAFGTPIDTPAVSPLQSPSISPEYTKSSHKSQKLAKFGHSLKQRPPLIPRPSYFRSRSSEDVLGRKKEERQLRRKWYDNPKNEEYSLGAMAKSSMLTVNAPGQGQSSADKANREKTKKAHLQLLKRKKAKEAEQKRITIHIADVLQRQRFVLRLGRALMLYGAPSHRLEEYLRMTARVLEIDAQFLYMPGCILVSFGDAATHTSETKIIRVAQGLNLTKLDATHLIYKEVVHDIMGLEEAGDRIDQLLKAKNFYPKWLVVIFFGLASGFIALYGFGGKWPDLPITFCLGCMVGFLQIQVAPRSDLYGNVFEVSSSILTSFLGRAFGSISRNGKYVFCFAALTQGSLALILPGYIILIGALELQSKNLVAGAVRMFYAIIYSTFLAFGIALGSAIYGWMDNNATNDSVCSAQLSHYWRILFVPLAASGLAMVNQASPRQLPSMIVIASAGYTALYFIQAKIANASSFTSALGAFTIGILGNLYSRLGHGLAFAAMLPGIFVIVPGGVAAQRSLVAGVTLANQITNSSSDSTSAVASTSSDITSLGGAMTQVAVGITVGLFVATLLVYPLGLGKKRSGLFTF